MDESIDDLREVETHTLVKIELLDCYSSNFTFVSLVLLTLSNIVQSILSSVTPCAPCACNKTPSSNPEFIKPKCLRSTRCLQSSRHSRLCIKGTSGFDHHCPWVNNCIGKSNHKPFFTLQVMIMLQFPGF
ncbi:hypothetical protein BLNAU_20842 [Blattamonas nauphoetae]|uniref:Palmitoyltransferase n=1 Tax=Blattamonas nauphoetae TaxID=2049346 RepID=A0ABQ9WZS3_9EUKA|nr:hypothetical protein BLNAU_20842 [Blattamonas nauphoetae]